MPPRMQRILFTGYAPVHFVCFQSLYASLASNPRFDVFVSGGLRSEEEVEDSDVKVRVHDAAALYKPFGVPDDHILSVEQIAGEDFDVIFGANTNLILPRSVQSRVQIFHGISFRNKSIREENTGCDHYFIVGPYMQRKFAEAGLIQADDPRALHIGFMKTDRLRDGSLSRDVLLKQFALGGERPIVLFAPTGQRNNSMETMGEAALTRLKATDRYDILIKLHDHPKDTSIDWFGRLAPLEDAHFKVVRDPDVIPLLFLADLLLTDASSVSSEFSLLNRPMVFLDVPKLLAKAAKTGSLDTETWGRRCGDVVTSPEEIAESIDLAFHKPERYAEIRRAMAQDLFYNPGQATNAAMRWLETRFADAVASNT